MEADTTPQFAPLAIATLVTEKAMDSLLEAQSEFGANQGHYADSHPWLVANEILQAQQAQGQGLALLLALQSETTARFAYWGEIVSIEVVEFHRSSWQSRVTFQHLRPINPIWQDIDSVMVWPSEEQRQRESKEQIRIFRTPLDEHHIHPYAVCETPEFISLGVP